jgi:hypothetical protein
MLFVKYLLLSAGIGMFVTAAAILAYDTYLLMSHRRRLVPEGTTPSPEPAVRWRIPTALVMLAWAPILVSAAIVIVPAGMGGVRVSQTRGTLAGTLYPGVHYVAPLVERVELFDTRDQLFTTGVTEDSLAKSGTKGEALHVQAKEGLTLAWRSRCGISSIRSGLTMWRLIFRSRSKKKLCRRWWLRRGARLFPITACAKFSPLNAKRSGNGLLTRFASAWGPTESS